MTWVELGDWWLEELASDPAYSGEIAPFVIDLLSPRRPNLYLDVGCGEGRLLAALAGANIDVLGCDTNIRLLRLARRHAPVLREHLPELRSIRHSSIDGAFASLVLEHLADESSFFRSLARVVRPAGLLVLVMNHPIWTAPGSSPIEDGSGEILWRPGGYFGRGYSDEPAGRRKVRFYHRTMAALLTEASMAGWDLERIEERGISPEQIAHFPEYEGQEHIPRLVGARWLRRL